MNHKIRQSDEYLLICTTNGEGVSCNNTTMIVRGVDLEKYFNILLTSALGVIGIDPLKQTEIGFDKSEEGVEQCFSDGDEWGEKGKIVYHLITTGKKYELKI